MKKKFFDKIKERIPSLEGVSISLWPPSLGISLSKKNSPKNLDLFKRLVEKSKWRKENIDHKEIWICEDDESFQIFIGDNYQEFSESWTQVYPNQFGSGRYSVYLNIGGNTIKETSFISCDGGRIFVPMPQTEMKGHQATFFWNKNSLEYKIGLIIGQYYIYNSIEGIAKKSNVEIR